MRVACVAEQPRTPEGCFTWFSLKLPLEGEALQGEGTASGTCKQMLDIAILNNQRGSQTTVGTVKEREGRRGVEVSIEEAQLPANDVVVSGSHHLGSHQICSCNVQSVIVKSRLRNCGKLRSGRPQVREKQNKSPIRAVCVPPSWPRPPGVRTARDLTQHPGWWDIRPWLALYMETADSVRKTGDCVFCRHCAKTPIWSQASYSVTHPADVARFLATRFSS